MAKAVQAQTGDSSYGKSEACRHWRSLLQAMDSLGGTQHLRVRTHYLPRDRVHAMRLFTPRPNALRCNRH